MTSILFVGSNQAAAAPLTGTVTISGTPAPGRTITANPEGWEPNSTFSYQWSRSGQAIATTRNVRILDDDVADTIYMVTVTAQKNGFEDGVAQQSITVQTSVPSAPSGLTAVANGRAVQLAWSAPVNTGGMPLYTYRVQYRPTTGGSWKTFAHSDSPATSLTVTGLPGGTDYQFRVSSVNTVGVSIPTSPVTATTAPPDAPTTPGAPTAVAGYSRVTLTWTQPANAAAAAPFAYIVECYRDSGTAIQAPGYPLHQWVRCPSASEGASPTPNAGGQVSYAVTGLPQYYYKFRVTAVNMTGASAVSAESNRLRPNTSAPSRPRNMAGVVASDGMSITLTWNPPANLYGTPLKQYELRWYQNGRYVPLPTDDRGIVPADQPRRYVWTGYERDESSASPLGKNFYLGVFACNVDDVCSSRTRIRVRLGTPRPPTGIQTVGHDGEGYVAWTPGVISSIYGPTAYYEVEYRTGAAGYTRVTAANSNYPAITIPGLTNGKQYDVRVRAVGFNGRATAWLTTTHHTPLKPVAGTGRALGPVGDLTGQTGVERVHLTWTAPAPSADQPAAVDYLIERSNAPTGPWLVVRDGLSTETAVTVGNLRAGSQYYLRVRAINVNGLSAPSVTGPFEPTAATAPGVPTNFFGQASDNAVELSWQRPADDGGAVITAYPIQYREFGTPEWLAVPEDEEDEDESDEDDPADEEEVEAPTSFLFAGLDMDTAYEFRIAASNHAGDSEWSAPIRVTTGILSDPPTGLAAVGRYEAVGLSWTPPVYTGSQPIIGYRIEYRPQNSVQPWSVLDTLSDATMATVRNLVNGQVYDFQVRTVTYVGVSEPAMISATPGGLLVCDPPTNLTGLAGITSAALMWTAPSNAVACEVEDYIVEYRLAGDPTWTAWIEWQHEPSTETAALVEDLIHNSAYEFRVSAYNGAISDPSNVLQLTIDGSYEVPYAPEDVWSEAGYGVATLHWMAPSWDGGTPVVDYTVQVRQATAAVWDVYDDGVSADLQAVLELDPTLNFNCRVAARNVLGRGPYSDAVDCRSLVPPQAPAAPVGLTATAQDQAAALAWTAPSDNGGADITSYLVRYRSSGGSWTEQAVATATPTSVVVSGLANGTAYDFQVAAVNLAGHGAWSSTATATPDDGVVPPPVAPVNVTADVQVGCEQAVVSWSALADAVVDHYAVDYKLSSATAWTTRDAAAGQLSTTIAGLTAGAYDFRVQAVNAKGAGPWSTAVTATVVACLVAPT
ncbi:MAG: fibronectin type III domain-containing protein, partial [Propionibacteriaceae bacterium]|nr:fibronectin type III domain-containing protein [Propionibacteriaceae bacterium]